MILFIFFPSSSIWLVVLLDSGTETEFKAYLQIFKEINYYSSSAALEMLKNSPKTCIGFLVNTWSCLITGQFHPVAL